MSSDGTKLPGIVRTSHTELPSTPANSSSDTIACFSTRRTPPM